MNKKVFDAISITLGVLFLYTLFSFIRGFVRSPYLSTSYVLYFIPAIAGITGLLIFVSSGYKKSGLLRMFMCYEVFSFPFILFYYYTLLTRDTGLNRINFNFGWEFFAGIAVNVLYFSVCAVGLWFISKKRVPRIIYFGTGESRAGQFSPANGGLRFANRLIDGVIISVVTFRAISNYFLYRNSYFGNDYDLNDSPLLLYLVEIPAILIYYLLLEGIFNTTAGKCATGTTIVNDSGGRPGFAQVLGRTFCRLIPFDAFSFFGSNARGWHDSIPNTWVVQTVDEADTALDEITLDVELDNK